MLDKHLKAETRPKSLKENEVYFEDYRITVLSDRLFRIEKDAEKKFEDGATQTVWFRDMPKQNFEVNEKKTFVEIKTEKVTLVVNKNFNKSYVLLNGNEVALDNAENLLGTARTLDGFDGNKRVYDKVNPDVDEFIELNVGVCSNSGVAVIDDKESLILNEEGKIEERRAEEVDSYVFTFGDDYRGAVKALYDICGYAPMIPRYALGNWWSRYYPYNDNQYLNLLDRIAKRNVPLTVATIDMDWHYANYTAEELNIPEEYLKDPDICGKNLYNKDGQFIGQRLGWTGYTWNKNLFPDYKAFLKEIKKRNLKITLNLHPAQGVRFYESQYEDFCKAMGVDSSTKRAVQFDFTDDNFINNYFKILHKPYEKDGVEFWWIDWQQGNKTKIAGLDPLWVLNHYHTYDNALNHQYPLVMSRYCGVGAHRYPLGFTGDTSITWDTLGYLPFYNVNASNIGYSWWSHDIGGHHMGYTDGELYVRSIQFGVFNPIMRLHCTSAETLTKESSYFMNGAGYIADEYMRFRHKLIPYLYTADYRTHSEAKALCEPLYYEEPEIKDAYEYKNEYYFGSELLVAPITEKGNGELGKVKAYIPKGRWTDIFTGEEYEGGTSKTLYRFLDNIPVLAKSGAILPLAEVEGNSVENPKELTVLVFNGNNEYKLYEDDDRSKGFTVFNNSDTDGKVILKFVSDKISAIPKSRKINFEFRNLRGGKVSVKANGKEIAYSVHNDKYLIVTVDKIIRGVNYEIEIEYEKRSERDYALERAKDILTRMSGINDVKKNLYIALTKEEDVKKFKDIIEASEISKNAKLKFKEDLF